MQALRHCFLSSLLMITASLQGEPLPEWAGAAVDGSDPRVAVSPVVQPRFAHLAWPKAVRTADGTIVLGFLIGTHHGDASCPAVSISTDDGKTFSSPHILRKFNPEEEYTNSGNMGLGIAHDGAVILMAHGMRGNEANTIFGWRSADSGRTWQAIDTSALGPNKTGSVTGSIVQLPNNRLMAVGHYRDPSTPYARGIWQSISEDDGLSWGAPSLVTNVDAGEPVLVRHEDRLMIFIRARGPAKALQFIAVSDNWGNTWRTEVSNVSVRNPHSTVITHPFAMVNPLNPEELLAVTIERPLPSLATLWRGDPTSLNFIPDRTLLELPSVRGSPYTDFGYPWLVHLDGNRFLLFYYHGKGRGECLIWVKEFSL